MQIEDSVSYHFLAGCRVGNLSSVKRNVDQAELQSNRDENGNTGLILAAEGGQVHVVRFLMKIDDQPLHLNSVNNEGRSALMMAADSMQEEVVKELINHPWVDREIIDISGLNAAAIGQKRGSRQIVELLGGIFIEPPPRHGLPPLPKEGLPPLPGQVLLRSPPRHRSFDVQDPPRLDTEEKRKSSSLPRMKNVAQNVGMAARIKRNSKIMVGSLNPFHAETKSKMQNPEIKRKEPTITHELPNNFDTSEAPEDLNSLGAAALVKNEQTSGHETQNGDLIDLSDVDEVSILDDIDLPDVPTTDLPKIRKERPLMVALQDEQDDIDLPDVPTTDLPKVREERPLMVALQDEHPDVKEAEAKDAKPRGRKASEVKVMLDEFANKHDKKTNSFNSLPDIHNTETSEHSIDPFEDKYFSDEEVTTTTINDDLVTEVRKNIIAKIDEYNDKIAMEEKAGVSSDALRIQIRKETSLMMTEINQDKKEFFQKHRKERDQFEKKQKEEMVAFQKKIVEKQEELRLEQEALKNDVIAREKRIGNFRTIVEALVARLSNIGDITLISSAGVTLRKKKGADSAISEMECPVCWESMTPPKKIYQCRQGHAICGNCYEKPQIKNCPTCRGAFIGRATVLEKIAANIFSA